VTLRAVVKAGGSMGVDRDAVADLVADIARSDEIVLVLAGVSEEPTLGVPLDGVVEVRLGDVLRPERISGQEARLRVLALLRSDVNRHAGTLLP
jgi:hypothetical protein